MSTMQLAIENLTIRIASAATPIVDDISLAIPQGGSLCVIGETGSGKSLIAQAVMGLLPASLQAHGTIRMVGRAPMSPQDRTALRALWSLETSIIPQEPGTAFDPLMRIRLQLGNRHQHLQGRVATALDEVDLPASTAQAYPFQLSGGMAQRVLVAYAGLSEAALVIADEPTKGLDGPRIAQVVALLRQLRETGKTLLVITHDLSVARGLGGMVAVMRDGVIVERGDAANVLGQPQDRYTQAWLAADPANWPACETCLHADDMVLAAHGLTVGYGAAAPLFRGLDLHVRKAEVLAVVGPSGVGKSTLGNVLLGLQPPLGGEVSWAGCDPYRNPAGARRLRRRYQKLHQDPGTVFVPHRTIGAQLSDVAPPNNKADDPHHLPQLLDRLKLKPDLLMRRIGEISGGEAQRLALARLLLMKPALIVADEPTSRLDPIVQQQTMSLLHDIVRQDGLALVLISHQKDVIKAVADDVIEIAAS